MFLPLSFIIGKFTIILKLTQNLELLTCMLVWQKDFVYNTFLIVTMSLFKTSPLHFIITAVPTVCNVKHFFFLIKDE